MAKRSYSDVDKATILAALDANGGNVNKTAKELHIPRATIQEWMNGRVSDDVPNIRQEKKLELSELIDNEIYAIFEAMQTKRNTAAYSNLATAIGILVDKKQLLAGKATERKEVTGKDGGAIETRVTMLSELSDEQLDDIIAGKPPASQRGESAAGVATELLSI